MAIATATSLDVYVGGKLLFEEVSFKLEPGDRMTLSGRNGAGKSTLLRVLAGELAPDAGSLSLQRGARVALHDQRPPRQSQTTLGEYVFSGRTDMLETEAELARLEAEMGGGEVGEETMAAYAAPRRGSKPAAATAGATTCSPSSAASASAPSTPSAPLKTFTGGELTRASLARALAAKPDLLLLDEPTNHLDIPSLEWLERYLVDLDAAVVLVAHDRWFLEAVGTSVLELEAQRARFFAGPWHAWRQEQAARQIALGKAIERQQAEIARMERFVERFRYKATKARQAQSRVKKIEKAKREGPAAERRDTRRLRFSFKPPERPGRVVLKLVKGRIEVPGRVLLEDAEMELERGEHVVLVGANGSGKTTPDRDPRRRPPAGLGQRPQRPQRQARLPLPARRHGGGGGDRARRRPARDRPHRAEGARPARRLPLLRRGRRKAALRDLAAASSGGSRWRSSSPPAPTCWSSTSRPTTSTSRAARRSRTR